MTSQENLETILEQASGLDWRVGIYVVGDAAMVMALDTFEATDATLSNGVRSRALRHAYSLVPSAMERARGAGIGITLQHALVYSLAGNMRTYWGESRTSDCTPLRA